MAITRFLAITAFVTSVPLLVLTIAATLASGETHESELAWASNVIRVFWVALFCWLVLVALTVRSYVRNLRRSSRLRL